jgi:hypothetical protein
MYNPAVILSGTPKKRASRRAKIASRGVKLAAGEANLAADFLQVAEVGARSCAG